MSTQYLSDRDELRWTSDINDHRIDELHEEASKLRMTLYAVRVLLLEEGYHYPNEIIRLIENTLGIEDE